MNKRRENDNSCVSVKQREKKHVRGVKRRITRSLSKVYLKKGVLIATNSDYFSTRVRNRCLISVVYEVGIGLKQAEFFLILLLQRSHRIFNWQENTSRETREKHHRLLQAPNKIALLNLITSLFGPNIGPTIGIGLSLYIVDVVSFTYNVDTNSLVNTVEK